ncbi:MAG: cysteine--1-D-myo-inosityl 2-amino-2-deoxy-alpha-D-glucopyranoside ligase [Actinomycetales bacterium]
MRSWSVADPPPLPGVGPGLRLWDTATRQIRPTAPGNPARMYVCGITPYDATHLGHAATYVAFDLVNRCWRDCGLSVDYVQNVTDVDDPLLERARQTGADWQQLASDQTHLFTEDMRALNVLPPKEYLGAVETIPLVITRIQELRDRGAIYSVDDDLYFSVRSDPRFGEVSALDQAEMLRIFAERGGDPDRPGKRDPLVCLVWLAERDGDPSWESPFGRGRPGWHIECVAIALEHLGMCLDLQGGGSDLIFPHHEMGAAEAQVVTGQWPYARHYVHTGMVGWQGHKMSKSRGNLVFVSRLRESGVNPMAIRLAILAHHYRQDWEWSEEGLRAAGMQLERWRQGVTMATGPVGVAVLERMRTCLSDDLDTSGALAAVDNWVESAIQGRGSDAEAPSLIAHAVDALLGVRLR